MRTAILLASSAAAVTTPPPDQLFRQDNFKGKCYDACKGDNNQAGLCEDFCGEGGYCCSGENYHRGNGPEKNGDCPAGAVGAIYTNVHTCAIPMSIKDAPKEWATYVQDNSKTDDSSCFISCGKWGGSCPEVCGEGGFCCSGNGHHYGNGPWKNGNCPQAAIDAIDDSVISYRCAVPIPTTPAPEPVCEVSSDATPLEDEEYKIIPQDAETTVNWPKARQQCKSYGKHWDLAIFNYEREFTRIQKILQENCVADHAYWIGYRENDGVTTTQYGQRVRTTAGYGATVSIDLPWAENEPNDNLGNEQCVRYNAQEGTVNDAICGRTWTGAKKDGIGMGIICEKHNPCEQDRGDRTVEFENKRYYISKAQFINANDAKIACQARGKHWDLAIIEDKQEHSFLNKKIGWMCSILAWNDKSNWNGIERPSRK